MIEIAFLGSGSSGNCAVIRAGRTAVLLDAGLSARETKRRLAMVGIGIEEIGAVFLTHEHADHVHGAAALNGRHGLPIHATEGTAYAARLPGPLFADIRTVRAGDDVTIGGELQVRVTSTPHDGTESVCYVFADGGGHRIGVVTDLGHLSREVLDGLKGCEVLGLEANHDVDLLRTGPYPVSLKKRILSDVGHLSNDEAAAGLRELVGDRTSSVVALHISKQNNTPALAAGAFETALLGLGVRVALRVARPDAPTGWIRG